MGRQSRWVILMEGTRVMGKLRREVHVGSAAGPGLRTPGTVLCMELPGVPAAAAQIHPGERSYRVRGHTWRYRYRNHIYGAT